MMFKQSAQQYCILFSLFSNTLSAPTLRPRDNSTDSKKIVESTQAIYNKNTLALLHSSSTCSPSTIAIRRAWDDLSATDRLSYINAVKCLDALPPQTPKNLSAAINNRRDDFTYTHIVQSNFMHASGLLLPWHRQFIWAYEQTLIKECNYTGALPYWAWERHSANQSANPVFQAGPNSFGTNGLAITHGPSNGSTVGVEPPFTLPNSAGTGGGAVHDGAFAYSTITLGPVSSVANASTIPNDAGYGLLSNPRFTTRDFQQPLSTAYLTYDTLAVLFQTDSIHAFHTLLENEVGAHAMSHAFLGGELGDFYSSPNDPVFYLLHAQIDRLWTLWQGGDYGSETDELDGTVTFQDRPPSENATLGTVMHMGFPAGGDVPVGEVMSAIHGEYCYMYA